MTKTSSRSEIKIFSGRMLEHIHYEFRKWRSDNKFDENTYTPDDQLYLSIDKYCYENEDLKLYNDKYNIHEMLIMLIYFECKHIYDTQDYRMVLRWIEDDYWESLMRYKIKELDSDDESDSDDEPKIVEKIVEVIVEKKIDKSYDFTLLKQSLDNPCCAICAKSIVDGKIYILDCGHIRHEACLSPDTKCQLCELNEWDVISP
jgi:hypothetical protein